MDTLLKDMYSTFGIITRIIAPLAGRYAYATLKREEERLARGSTYEPTSFYEKNDAAIALEKDDPLRSRFKTPRIEWVTAG